MGELAGRCLDEHVAVRYKPRSIPPTRTVVNRYIVPEFGKMSLRSVERGHITEFQQRLHDKPYIANMVAGAGVHAVEIIGLDEMPPPPCGGCSSTG